MFIDGQSVPDGATIETDLAIVGAGAAGISIARELAGSGISVALIESGGFEFDADTQDLYEGEMAGVEYPLTSSRLRYFGGTTNHWGGWTRPLEPIDFEERDWVPHSGWPITRAILDPYYERAADVCQLRSTAFDDASAWAEGGEPLPLAGDEVMTRFFIYSPPTRFGKKYRPDIESAKNVTCYLNSNVMEIVPTENGARVETLRIGTLSGVRFEVKPKVCILAAGAIENARILLLSNSVERDGLGNRNGLVGRFFMEHPHIPSPATFLVTDPDHVARFYRTYTKLQNSVVRGCFLFSPEYLRRTRRMGTVLTFGMSYAVTETTGTEPDNRDPAAWIQPLVLKLARDTTSAAAPNTEYGWRIGVGCASEQEPNPASRITLSNEKDALGLARTRLAWRLRKSDAASLRGNLEALARAFGAWGEGRVRVLFPERDEWTVAEGWGNHHMGTTRMAADPKKGVTDADCRVHGMSNLYIAGSSLYPTGGTVNPTLTLVALALRLTDHLKSRFEEGAFA
ncbi:MAG: GMC family oxidoreductase [Parvibaculum sp.]|nr:GMC family oxidoreductase [Parvibaculum sp.]